MNNPTEPLGFPGHSGAGPEDTPLKGTRQGADGTLSVARPPVRVGTLVWGAVVVVIGILVLVTRQAGLPLDTGQTSMWLLFGAGLAMVAGGAVNVLRRK
ncbi:hypothetical protein [Arthrobacter sp.]|uniref:hypothetical protein n=1 Tax=Arthrobacter sp. TaxID=1667 RepID=UPI00258DE441|nr:hypothetical protein [Arthrobacter sp.]